MVDEMRQELGYALGMVSLVVGTILTLVGIWYLGYALTGGNDNLASGAAFLLVGIVLAVLGYMRRSQRDTDDDALP